MCRVAEKAIHCVCCKIRVTGVVLKYLFSKLCSLKWASVSQDHGVCALVVFLLNRFFYLPGSLFPEATWSFTPARCLPRSKSNWQNLSALYIKTKFSSNTEIPNSMTNMLKKTKIYEKSHKPYMQLLTSSFPPVSSFFMRFKRMWFAVFLPPVKVCSAV